jgi:hypothetical protein
LVPAPEVKALRTTGVLLVALAVAANERFLASVLAPDGTLSSGTIAAVRAAEALLVAAGLACLLAAPRLAGLLERCMPFRAEGSAPRVILALGIALRIAVYLFLRPNNNDPHQEFIDFVLREGRLPIASEVVLGFQPPLYYLLAAPWSALGSPKVVQLLSLLLSVGHLALLARWIGRTPLLESPAARCHALALAAFLPQFVLFGLFVSNDALAFPLGTLVLILVLAYLEEPRQRNLVLAALVQGLALLTKGTALATLPVLLAAVVLSGVRRRLRVPRIALDLALAGSLTVLVGGYKFVENQIHFGTPVVSNDEIGQAYVAAQQGTYRGLSSWLDVNVLELARDPFQTREMRLAPENVPVMHSVPLLFYGTFWYSYIEESDFIATRAHPFHAIPRALYLAAVPATLVILAGAAAALARVARVRSWLHADPATFARRAGELVLLGALAASATLVLRWALKHDAWSFFQSRLAFGSFLTVALAWAFGFELLERPAPVMRVLAGFSAALLYALLAAYWLVELGVQMTTNA